MTPADRAQLALLLEVAATPTPGAVDRRHDHADLRFEDLLAGAVGARGGLRAAAAGGPIGASFRTAVEGMAAAQPAGNTQFGALLLLTPLVRAASEGPLSPESAAAAVEATDVEDAAAFCRAFGAVDVGLGPPPDGLAEVDVRRPAEAAAAVRDRELTLAGLMAESAEVDGIAREWAEGFGRTFAAADRLGEGSDLVGRAPEVYLELLAAEPDPFVATRHDAATAEAVRAGAESVLAGDRSAAALAEELLEDGVNPGTTADLLAGGLYVALERGAEA